MNAATPNSWLPQPLRRLAGRALETALNHALSLDPDTQQRLAALNGRSVQLHLRGPEIALAVTVDDARLRVDPPQDGSQLKVTATPGSLLAMMFRRDDDSIAPGKVEIAGDAELARRLEKLAGKFAPDFEEAFARTFGDVLGVPLAAAVRKGFTHARETASHLTEDSADWLRDEVRVAMAPGEVEGFLDGVDDVRERSERLESRVRRLLQRLQDNAA
ncbi:sterol-binding protein [Rhodanobacter thiooxydans]|uniref:Ubiquinone biosynthesis accessory factor UbiJ n=1 Tax=Rhodanobacter thiooxydans TaxID=416169 RepID=A0A154QFM8_9GAMM|nr:SCP2 sterol-binding domain-containing protein [Rhodanobacter thiooxydans]EIL98076.1 sterol-binding domain-containing protein [Rhodanobacter thiooxydans LCS2]KZC23092.1 sterol-binding protein [Rhodanobacter thiooxydans]MCW0200732.1 SCP2 sterol-binding domain-containing protein [Rhodanobacter thiooxydans]